MKAWWVCDKGPDHEWGAQVKARTRGTGCPMCKGDSVSITNSLASLFPEVAAQWHPTKNSPLQPSGVLAKSRHKVWWKCDGGQDHEWQTTVGNRTCGDKTGCPMCSRKRVSAATSLQTVFPEMAAEWHPTKNGTLLPSQVSVQSHRKVWWLCSEDPTHEWVARVYSRTNPKQLSGCHLCTRKMERLLFEVSRKVFDGYEVQHEARPGWLERLRLDIYVPALHLAIERQGQQHYAPVEFFGGIKKFQQNVERDQRKRELCEANGVKLVEVRYDAPHTEDYVRQICGL